jgi:hypothetical protein
MTAERLAWRLVTFLMQVIGICVAYLIIPSVKGFVLELGAFSLILAGFLMWDLYRAEKRG